MRGSFNKPRLMGNCENCYYYTPRPGASSDDGVCHRYPKPLERGHGDYCGEFVWKSDVANVGGDAE